MNYYEHLYMGEKAKERRYGILQGLRERRLLPEVYVIMPPLNGNNILDIYPAYMLLLGKYREQEFKILGIAEGYQEALELSGTIINEMYKKTGGFCLEEFLAERGSRV